MHNHASDSNGIKPPISVETSASVFFSESYIHNKWFTCIAPTFCACVRSRFGSGVSCVESRVKNSNEALFLKTRTLH